MTVRHPIVLDDEWNMGIELKVPMAVTNGRCLFTRGQIDVDGQANVLNTDDAKAQTQACACHIGRVFDAVDINAASTLLVNHYTSATSVTALSEMEATVRASLLKGAEAPVALIPVPYFYYPGIEIETDVIASLTGPARYVSGALPDNGALRGAIFDDGMFLAGHWTPQDEGGSGKIDLASHVQTVVRDSFAEDCAGRLWVHVAASTLEEVRNLAQRVECQIDGWSSHVIPCVMPGFHGHFVSISGFAGTDYAFTTEPETGIDFMIGPRFAFVDLISPVSTETEHDSGSREELMVHTRSVMTRVERALTNMGFDFARVLKATTYYVGDDSEDDLYANLQIRDTYYDHPGPASTGVPFKTLDRKGARIAVSLQLASQLSDADQPSQGT